MGQNENILTGIAGLTWNDQNLGRKVKVKYIEIYIFVTPSPAYEMLSHKWKCR